MGQKGANSNIKIDQNHSANKQLASFEQKKARANYEELRKVL